MTANGKKIISWTAKLEWQLVKEIEERFQEKLSEKIMIMGNIEKRLEELDLYVKTRNIDTDDDLLED